MDYGALSKRGIANSVHNSGSILRLWFPLGQGSKRQIERDLRDNATTVADRRGEGTRRNKSCAPIEARDPFSQFRGRHQSPGELAKREVRANASQTWRDDS